MERACLGGGPQAKVARAGHSVALLIQRDEAQIYVPSTRVTDQA